jgi:hypothetical protein
MEHEPTVFPEGAKVGEDRKDGAERLAVALARMWTQHPESLAQAIRALEGSRAGNGRS